MRIVTYARKSQANEDAVERQSVLAREFAESRGWSVVGKYEDDGVSGREFVDRPEFNGMLSAAKSKPRPFDAIVTMAIDRAGRDYVRSLSAFQELAESGVAIWTYSDGREVPFATARDKVMVGMSAFAAEDYAAEIARKTREALRYKARQGHAVGAPVFGYYLHEVGLKHKVRKIQDEQAKAVRRVFELTAQGLGARKVMNTLIAESVPAPTRKGWSKGAIKAILNRDAYLGRIVFGRTKNAAKDGKAEIRVDVPEAEWYTAQDESLRIISDELWKATQKSRKRTNGTLVRQAHGKLNGRVEGGLLARYLMNGLGRCHECGGALTFVSKGTDKRRHLKYYCSTRRESGRCKNGTGVPMKAFDDAVRLRLDALLLEDEEMHWQLITERAAQWRKDTARPAELVENAQKELDRVQGEIERLVAALASGVKSAAVLGEITKREAQAEALKLKLTEAPVFNPTRQELHEGLVNIRTLRNGTRIIDDPSKDYIVFEYAPIGPLTTGSVQEVRAILRRLQIERVTVIPQGDGTWRFEGTANLAGLFSGQGRDSEAPPDSPHRSKVFDVRPALASPAGSCGFSEMRSVR